MIPVEEARRIVLGCMRSTEVREVPAWQAAGLPLAADIETDIDLAPFANSAMDGYALHAADLAAATADGPVVLDVVGHEAAGHVFEGEVGDGQTVRIMTGAPVPEGLDAVVKYEVVEVLEGDGNEGSRVSFTAPASPARISAPQVSRPVRAMWSWPPARSLRRRARACLPMPAMRCAGASRPARGHHLARHRARRCRCVVPARGQIRDVNGPALMASAREAGAEPVFYGIAPDDEERICELVRRAASECDVVVTSGGASAGDYDYVTALIEREGEVLFDRVSIKPGKAVTFGLLGETPFFGLSGNPAGAFVGFELFVRPALRKMMGHTELERPVQEARATHGIKKRPGRAGTTVRAWSEPVPMASSR